jgi:glyoxylase-like metal-dependent hydrolase (beta-lactamase superfamily II)
MKFALFALAAAFATAASAQNFDAVQIKTTKVAEHLYMLEGEGGNIAVSAGDDGVMMIDDQYAPLTPRILAAIKQISDKPVRFLINTHWHFDHTGGNENLGKAGVLIVAHDNVYQRMANAGVIELLKKQLPPSPKEALPVITFNDTVTFHFNGEEITATHVPPAHTDGDSFIRFKKANVVHTGDVFAAYRYPFIDVGNKGSVEGIIRDIDAFLPTIDEQTQVIPGHGPLSHKKDVIAYRQMISTVAGRVKALVAEGKTLNQVLAAKPTREFDEEWGKFRKPEQFVEIMYFGFAH